jgi:TPR repeat protein
VQWLRERNLGSMYASEPAPSHGWKYAIAGLIIVLGGFAYLQWGSQLPSWIASPAATARSTSSNPAQPVLGGGSSSAASSSAASPSTSSSSATGKPAQPVPAPSGAGKPMSVAKSVDPQGHRDTRDQNTSRTGIEPAAQKSSLLATPLVPKPLDTANGGSADLQLAQRYLGGSMGARDSSEAAKLLWKAVRQENTTAAVLLSELYAHGDGVPKSCDQARLLLIAAAKRGASQAAEQLRTLETRGCQ